ncbi:hypothetical protein V5738_09485 [Salinisphaera sp. SPP-AMP-43]|uniref:hypothetical protein n=1 Tax=Salinisphaera sp. SPP-AMP-43 TaxID=3121288 RepID=UPI003C6E830B
MLRWQRRVYLAPAHELGVVRRAIILAALSWLPLVLWAAWAGRLWPGGPAGGSLIEHFPIHVRFLVAIPLLIIGEWPLHATLLRLTRWLGENGTLDAGQSRRYRAILRRLAQRRNTVLPHVVMMALVVFWTLVDGPDHASSEYAWARLGNGELGFGAFWGVYIARPIFVLLLLVWLWRLLLVILLFFRIGHLDLDLPPTHPDHMGGLQFIQELSKAWVLLTLAVSGVIASSWAYAILYTGATLATFKWQAGIFILVWAGLLLAPFMALSPVLIRTRKRALLNYGNLLRRHSRLVHQRWIEGKPVTDDGLLNAPEIGCVADAAALYDAVAAMRAIPIGKRALLLTLAPLVLPLLAVTALKIPLSTELARLLKMLV